MRNSVLKEVTDGPLPRLAGTVMEFCHIYTTGAPHRT